jgi:hypothetical protein
MCGNKDMPVANPDSFHDVSDGGISGDHPAQSLPPILVGPSTGSEFNTIHLPLVPVACWKVDDIRFAFDSSFINVDLTADENPNDVRAELAHLQTLMAKHVDSPLSIFGHADPVGSDEYNKSLSGRRAMSIYSLLTAQGDLSAAVSLWQKIAAHEKWGDDQRGQMASFTGLSSSTSTASLIQAYLQKLCPSTLVLSKKNFLGQGADPDGRGDYQGCSEFNPALLFSQEKQATYDQAKQQNDADGIAARNAANRPNRRVLVLLFRKGSVVTPSKWPCPSALVGQDVCKNRFWSDGETRRSKLLSGADREFKKTHDTYACRFYDRLTHHSPCKETYPPVALRWIGWVPDGCESQSSVALNGLDGSLIGNVEGTSYKVQNADGTCQRFELTLPGDSTNFQLSMVAQGNPFIPPALFAIKDLLAAQADAQKVGNAVKVDPFLDDEVN